MKKRSLALWAVLFVALFAVLSGGAGCDGGSDSDSSGGGTLSYEDFEGKWKFVGDPNGSRDSDFLESEITISDADGSDEGFDAHLNGYYRFKRINSSSGTPVVEIITRQINSDFKFTRLYAKDTPAGLPDRESLDEWLLFNFRGTVPETQGKGRLNFAADENTGQVGKDKILLRFLKGDFNWDSEVPEFDGYYVRQK